MKNILRVDHDKKIIVMDRMFVKNSSIVGSDEYILLQGARQDYPTYAVVKRHIKPNPNKESYKGLTYKYMETYIKGHENAEENLKEYNEKILQSKCHSIRYPAIKSWFLETYPEIADFGKNSDSAEITPFQEKKVA